MAQIEFYCPQCEEVIFSDPGLSGQEMNCPHCGHPLIIPTAEEAAGETE